MAKILIVDDEVDIQTTLSFALEDDGFEVKTATLPKEAEKIMATEKFDVAIFDIWFPEGDGIELLQWTKENHPSTNCIMMSGHGSVELALKAIRLGAYDFIEKPIELEKIILVISNALEISALKKQGEFLKSRLNQSISGTSDFAKQLRTQAKNIISNTKPAIYSLIGNIGTGRKNFVKHIEANHNKFYPVSCFNCSGKNESSIKNLLINSIIKNKNGAVIINNFENLSSELKKNLKEDLLQNKISNQNIICDLFFTFNDNVEEINIIGEKILFKSLQDRTDYIEVCEEILGSICQAMNISTPVLSSEVLDHLKKTSEVGNFLSAKNTLEKLVIHQPNVSTLTVD